MRVLPRQALRTFRADESGQSLIVIISAMTVLLVIAAFAIDTANWMVRHHDAQVVADSAALAAAQCLANPNQPATLEQNGQPVTLTCNSSTPDTNTQTAETVAVDYAAANGITIQPSDVTISGKVVTVKASTTTPSVFARVMGIGTTSQTAQAGASWTSNGFCTTAGQNCDFMFANSSACSSGSYALNVLTQGSSTINGNVQTNGNLYATGTGNAGGVNGTGNFGHDSACKQNHGGNHDPWQTGDPTRASQAMTWPIDYSKDFPACTPGTTCQGSGDVAPGYPSFCTNGSSNPIVLDDSTLADTPKAGQIYCASGSGHPYDPSTWNGTITITSSPNATNTWTDSFVAGEIDYAGKGNDTMSACGYTASGYSSATCSAPAPAGNTSNYPVFYAVGADPSSSACAAAGTNASTSCALSLNSGGNFTLYGDAFVQNGTASLSFQGNQSAGNTFIEANTIQANLAGNFNGDGPTVSGTTGTGGSGVTLVQ